MGLLWLLLAGLVVGALARLLVPGSRGLGCLGTIVLGIVGSFVGGFLGYVLLDKDVTEGAFQPSGFIGSLLGAVVALILYQRLAGNRSPR